ncbi:HlyD family secretion protein [Polymorphum gilvum]|uniref:Membrane fusion protein family auxiliary transport protein n=1 Tax=Polymorphum gilvum (strain LMG 25793 / CGMCC 1.9160 / SL003B-26A1) TaxID=991905 RepID=F2J0P3_POLGS|nr:HlyD family efflux transporter periplasmic adaptor subunit [Polymorphum gilvum]ADZ70729.1 Membrane fusion protein family auxiliary transport protein [Polymorphum gilvum SL003B-26A1]
MKFSKPAIIVIVVLLAAAGAGYGWWQTQNSRLPQTIASGNGRIEAETIHVATRTGGRVVEVLVGEGDFVEAGQVLARLDTEELEASLAGAEARVAAAKDTAASVTAQIAQRESELRYADQALQRATALLERGHISRQEVDQRQTARDTAEAALAAVRAQLANAERSVDAARAEVLRIGTVIAEAELKAPIAGRVQYRLAEPGEVLGAGGRVVTLLNLADVYMTIFLPTASVGRVFVGAEARIVLDAAPQYVIPAVVSFVAPDAQFTPREVETRSEREKLMFRVKIRVAPDLLREHLDKVRTGLPGEAYVMMAPGEDWPDRLAVRLPPQS